MPFIIEWIKDIGDGTTCEVVDDVPCSRLGVSDIEAHARVLYPIEKLRLGKDRINGFRIRGRDGFEAVYWVEGGCYRRVELR